MERGAATKFVHAHKWQQCPLATQSRKKTSHKNGTEFSRRIPRLFNLIPMVGGDYHWVMQLYLILMYIYIYILYCYVASHRVYVLKTCIYFLCVQPDLCAQWSLTVVSGLGEGAHDKIMYYIIFCVHSKFQNIFIVFRID